MAKYTAIGGQALIEGIMMKSPEKSAMAVRKQDGEIDISYLNGKNLRKKYKILALPIIRGVVAFAESLIEGYSAMMKSADISGFTDIEEETEAEKTQEQKEKDKKSNAVLMGVVMTIGTVLGVALAVLLFMAAPAYIRKGLEYLFNTQFSSIGISATEQVIKLAIFVGYIWLVSLEKDIKRVFMYHGAEHKTIFCYEKGLPLNVENVRKQQRFHPICGTSFMILMILVSFLISLLVLWAFPKIKTVTALWVAVKILLIPITCGVGFEVLRACGKHDNLFTKIVSAPGMWLQRLTTKEPSDDMIEIAIAALRACEPENPDVDRSIDKTEETAEETAEESAEDNGENDI